MTLSISTFSSSRRDTTCIHAEESETKERRELVAYEFIKSIKAMIFNIDNNNYFLERGVCKGGTRDPNPWLEKKIPAEMTFAGSRREIVSRLGHSTVAQVVLSINNFFSKCATSNF